MGVVTRKKCGSKGQRRRRFSGHELGSEREPVQEKTDATVSHWVLTSRKQADDDGDRSWNDGNYKPRKNKVCLKPFKLTELTKESPLQDFERLWPC